MMYSVTCMNMQNSITIMHLLYTIQCTLLIYLLWVTIQFISSVLTKQQELEKTAQIITQLVNIEHIWHFFRGENAQQMLLLFIYTLM